MARWWVVRCTVDRNGRIGELMSGFGSGCLLLLDWLSFRSACHRSKHPKAPGPIVAVPTCHDPSLRPRGWKTLRMDGSGKLCATCSASYGALVRSLGCQFAGASNQRLVEASAKDEEARFWVCFLGQLYSMVFFIESCRLFWFHLLA